VACLEEIFSSASPVVERLIIERISTKLGVDLRNKRLEDLVIELRAP